LEWIEFIGEEEDGPDMVPDFRPDFDAAVGPRLKGWSLAVTATLRYGFVPSGTQVGDSVAVILGSSVLFVLHPHPSGMWQLVGSCYFWHIMAGELVDFMQRQGHEPGLIALR
jgi:hypothetical protein